MVTKKSRHVFLMILALGAIIAFAFYLSRLIQGNETVQDLVAQYGYVGIFLISLISGFNLAIPVPAAAFMPLFLEAGLLFWPAIFLMAIGVTTADFIAYFFGKIGQQVVVHSADGNTLSRLENIRRRYYWGPIIFLFLFSSLAPFPNEIILVPMGFLGYHFLRILPVVFVGNFIFNILYVSSFANLFEVL